jgi:ketol-acid reductoisomerase
MAIIDFGGTKEEVITRKEFPIAKARKVLKRRNHCHHRLRRAGTGAVAEPARQRLQGHHRTGAAIQAGLGSGLKDGWVPGKTLFRHRRGGASAARSSRCWFRMPLNAPSGPASRSTSSPGDALYFSHGFSIAYRKQTKVIPPKDVDVIMVAPKGSGTSVRRNFLSGAGINSSFAVGRTPRPSPRNAAWRWASASVRVTCFPTTFEHEVFSDLTGERGVLMGALAGIMEAQYDVLRDQGHTPAKRSTRRWRN